MQNKHSIELILFDIDGTLLWPKGVGRESTRAAMLEIFGTTGTLDTHNFGGKTDWFTLVEVLTDEGYASDSIEQHMSIYEASIARHLEDIIAAYPIEPCPSALEVVQQLLSRGTIGMGLVTGNVSSTAPLKLRAAGFDPTWFPIGAYGSEAISRDDLPALALQRAIVHYGRDIAPNQVAVVGDTPADIACARALGAHAIAVKTGFASNESLSAAQPDALIDDLSTLLEVLNL